MNDNAVLSPARPNAPTPNYATLNYDHHHGLPWITDVKTHKPVYRYPACDICGMSPWWFSPTKPKDKACGFCHPSKCEANDVE